MPQFYLLTVVSTVVAGLALSSDHLGKKSDFFASFRFLRKTRSIQIAAGLITAVIGVLKLIFRSPGENVVVVGDLLPAAVGIILGAVVLSVATIIAGGVSGILIPSSEAQFVALAVSFFWLMIAVILAVFAQLVAINLFGTLTKGIDEQKEIKKGNLAVAVTLGAIIYSIAVIIQAGLPAF